MKKVLGFAFLTLAVLAGICLARVWSLPAPAAVGTPAAVIALDQEAVVARLAAGLRIPTISYEDRSKIDPGALAAFAEHLRISFPRVHATLRREAVGQSLLYTWEGRDATTRPILLTAHMDVVPIEPGTEAQWAQPPFGGAVAGDQVWGRGARDDKSSVLALLEAVELLVEAGFQPPRTVYLAFGHDEEIGGMQGAKQMAALLKSRGVRAEFLLDEGGAVLDGIVAGVKRPVAAIMAAEKGYLTLRLTTRAKGGHSSMPPKQTALGRLARAVARVQEAPLPARFERPVTDMFDRLAPEMAFGSRLMLVNRWLLGPLLLRQLAAQPVTNALIRTTTAPTVLRAGVKDNVLPSEASALVNFRLLPGDRIEGVIKHVQAAIGDDAVEVSRAGDFASEPSPPAPVDNAPYRLLAQTTREIFPEAVISTGLVVGGTDARHYAEVIESRYNFSPMPLRPADLPTVHGTDERIAIEDYLRMIRFYVQLLRNWAA